MMKRTVQKIKQFQRQKFWVVLALVCLQSAWVYAEESDEFPTSHGGELFNFESFYLELVARGGEITLFVTDHQNKGVNTENGQAAVIIVNDNERSKTSIDLKPNQENSLRGTGDFLIESKTTLTVFVKLFEKNAYVAKLVPSGKVFNVEDILDISDFCNYYYIYRDKHHVHQDFYYIYRIFCHLNNSQHNQSLQIQSPQNQSHQYDRVLNPQEKHRVKSSRESYDDGDEGYEEAESNRSRRKQSHEKNREPIHDHHEDEQEQEHDHDHTHDDHYHIHEHGDGSYHAHDHPEDEHDHEDEDEDEDEEEDEVEEDEEEDEEED